MKPIAVFVLVAVFSTITVAAGAKVVTMPGSDNDHVMQGVAGPVPDPNTSKAPTARADQSAAQPSKPDLKKAKVKPKPGLNDPN